MDLESAQTGIDQLAEQVAVRKRLAEMGQRREPARRRIASIAPTGPSPERGTYAGQPRPTSRWNASSTLVA